MIFRQLFDSVSGTYSYLIASRKGAEALIIDPVLEKVDRYIQLMDELDLRLVKAVDTHLHADHVTGLGALRDRTRCITVMGENSKADVVSMRLADGDKLDIEGVSLDVIYTPGHTDDSYSFALEDRVFTGDTLLIRGTGRTDFQNGDARAQYDSIFNRLLKLPNDTLVYPAHDYKGDTVSTIGEERRCNPRLQVKSVDEYVELMNNLKLPNPEDDGCGGSGQHAHRPGPGCRRPEGLGGSRRRGNGFSWAAGCRASRPPRKVGARAAWGYPGRIARALSETQGQSLNRRVAQGARSEQAGRVLLRLRRALRHGRASRPGGGHHIRLPHPRRHRCLEGGRWPYRALTSGSNDSSLTVWRRS